MIKSIKKELQTAKSQNTKSKNQIANLKKLIEKLEKQQQEAPRTG